MKNEIKYQILILLSLAITACNQTDSKKSIAAENFRYSAFYWGQDYEARKPVFLFAHYIAIEKNGAYVLMRTDYGSSKAIYYKGFINDSIINLIDSVCLNSSYKANYEIFNADSPMILYHGFTYCFDFSIDGKRNKEIQFIPYYSPMPIKRLGAMLDSTIFKITSSNIDTLYLESYKQKLIKISFPNLPPLPEPPPEPDKNIKPFDPNDYK